MADEHPYSIRIEPYTRDKSLFRWTIMKNGEDCTFSTRPYKTRAEAEAAAHTKMQELIASWRIGKRP
jgi:hypothetical protein